MKEHNESMQQYEHFLASQGNKDVFKLSLSSTNSFGSNYSNYLQNNRAPECNFVFLLQEVSA